MTRQSTERQRKYMQQWREEREAPEKPDDPRAEPKEFVLQPDGAQLSSLPLVPRDGPT